MQISSRAEHNPLDHLIWYLGRAYYTYIGVLERVLVDAGLERHVRPGMGHILFALFEKDDRSIKEIAERSQLACSTLTGMLDRMVTGRLIERRRDGSDGRMIRVRLTALGRSLEPRCKSALQTMDGILKQDMDEKSMVQAKGLLLRMIKAMKSEVELSVRAESSR